MFLLASAPLILVINNANLPRNIEIQGVSGSVWQGQIARITFNNNVVEQVKTELSFWSLFTLAPKVEVSFGGAMLAGSEGKFTLQMSTQQLALTELELFLKASELAKQLPFPMPVELQGNIELQLSEITIALGEKITCSAAQGELTWLRAEVLTLEQNIELGKLSAVIRCEKGDLFAKVNPKNNLGLSFDAQIALPAKQFLGKGYLKPDANFPAPLKSSLPFLGRPDNQGRYLLRF